MSESLSDRIVIEPVAQSTPTSSTSDGALVAQGAHLEVKKGTSDELIESLEPPTVILRGDGSNDPDEPKLGYETDLTPGSAQSVEPEEACGGGGLDDLLLDYTRKLALALGSCPVCGTEVIDGPDWIKWGFSVALIDAKQQPRPVHAELGCRADILTTVTRVSGHA